MVLTGPGQNITEQRLWNLPNGLTLSLANCPGTPLVGAKPPALVEEVCGAVGGSIPWEARRRTRRLLQSRSGICGQWNISVVNATAKRELKRVRVAANS